MERSSNRRKEKGNMKVRSVDTKEEWKYIKKREEKEKENEKSVEQR